MYRFMAMGKPKNSTFSPNRNAIPQMSSDSVNYHVSSTDNCQRDCFVHPDPQSTSPPGTKAFTKKVRTSTEQDITDVSG